MKQQDQIIIPSSTRALRPVAIAQVLECLGAALETRDGCTYQHSCRLIGYALTLGQVLGLSESVQAELQWGVFLHDIGKLHVHERILKKPGPLSEPEWREMRRHPSTGHRIARTAGLAGGVTDIVLAHHEWYDGTGYPHGLAGERIPLGARICAIVDTLDALTSLRPYHRPVSFEQACAAIGAERGSHFDPLIVDAFLSLTPAEWGALQTQAPDRLPLHLAGGMTAKEGPETRPFPAF